MDGGQNIAGRGSLGIVARPVIGRGAAAGLTLLSVLLWGFSPVITRYLVGNHGAALPPSGYAAIRYTMATLVFTPWLLRLRGWNRRDLALAGFLGVIGIAGFNLPATYGQRTVSAGLTGLLEAAAPLMIVVINALRARRAPGGWTIFASLLGLAGISLLAEGSGPVLGDPAGIAMILAAALAWALYCVLVPPLIKRHGALPVTAVVMLFGTVPLVFIGLPETAATLQQMTGFYWALMCTLVLGASVTAMILWNIGSAALGSEQAGWFMYMMPLVSLLGGAALLGEPIKLVEIFGGGLILLSVYLSQRQIKVAFD
jgi:drug/metabolite transporter (DMT)-like permease